MKVSINSSLVPELTEHTSGGLLENSVSKPGAAPAPAVGAFVIDLVLVIYLVKVEFGFKASTLTRFFPNGQSWSY